MKMLRLLMPLASLVLLTGATAPNDGSNVRSALYEGCSAWLANQPITPALLAAGWVKSGPATLTRVEGVTTTTIFVSPALSDLPASNPAEKRNCGVAFRSDAAYWAHNAEAAIARAWLQQKFPQANRIDGNAANDGSAWIDNEMRQDSTHNILFSVARSHPEKAMDMVVNVVAR